MRKSTLVAGLLVAALPAAAMAQQAIKIAGLVELSGTGATAGTNFDNGVKLAVKDSGMYVVKAVTEKLGMVDSKALSQAMKGARIAVKEHPGVLLDVTFDQNGDLDRESFLVKVVNGKQVVSEMLPPVSGK